MNIQARREVAIRRVVRAIENPGVSSGYHRMEMRQLAEGWPVLADALVELLDSHGVAPPDELRRDSRPANARRTS